jgi:hypothetical protein
MTGPLRVQKYKDGVMRQNEPGLCPAFLFGDGGRKKIPFQPVENRKNLGFSVETLNVMITNIPTLAQRCMN